MKLQFKYQKELQDCEDTLEAYHMLCHMVSNHDFYAEAYKNLLYFIHKYYFINGLNNPKFVLDTILRHYVMSFNEYEDKKSTLFSDMCGDRYFDDVINQYIDYEEVLFDDEDIEDLLPFSPLSDKLLFDWFIFDDDFQCYKEYGESTEEMKEIFQYAIGDSNDL